MFHEKGWMPVSLLVNKLTEKFLGVVNEQLVRDSWAEYESDPFPEEEMAQLMVKLRLSGAETHIWANLERWAQDGKLGVTSPLGTTALVTAEIGACNPYLRFKKLPPLDCPASPWLEVRVGTIGSGWVLNDQGDQMHPVLNDLKRQFGAFLHAPLVVEEKIANKAISDVSIAYL
jgi:hypothetical protein